MSAPWYPPVRTCALIRVTITTCTAIESEVAAVTYSEESRGETFREFVELLDKTLESVEYFDLIYVSFNNSLKVDELREGGRKGGREEGREGGREGRREGGREEGGERWRDGKS